MSARRTRAAAKGKTFDIDAASKLLRCRIEEPLPEVSVKDQRFLQEHYDCFTEPEKINIARIPNLIKGLQIRSAADRLRVRLTVVRRLDLCFRAQNILSDDAHPRVRSYLRSWNAGIHPTIKDKLDNDDVLLNFERAVNVAVKNAPTGSVTFSPKWSAIRKQAAAEIATNATAKRTSKTTYTIIRN